MWSCLLNSATIGSYIMNQPTIIYFNTNTPYINVLEWFFIILSNAFFDIHHNLRCFFNRYSTDKGRCIACEKEYFSLYKTIIMTFDLDGNVFRLLDKKPMIVIHGY